METAINAGTSVLSISLKWLFKELETKYNEWKQVRDDLQNWKSFLPKLCAVLDDAEKRQTTNRAVEMWLSDLRELAYEMEDVLDELEADERRKKLTAKSHLPSMSKARKLIPKFFTDFKDSILDNEVVSKIKEITIQLERVMKEKQALGLKVEEAITRVTPPQWQPTTTTSLPETHICGRESEKDSILQKLLNDEGSDENPCVIPIVGMAGLGKTTLARLVYNDDGLNGVFEPKAWVCVSNEFNVHRIIRSIFEQITQSKCDFEDPSVLQGKVNNMLSGKKFLLVLDDIWNEDYNTWEEVQKVFKSGASGSKIIVTSRSLGAARTMGASDRIYHLKELPENQWLSLLARHALGRENFDMHMNLKDIGEKLVKKCRGLPLAIKTLGGLLRGELNPDRWMEVLESDIWELQGGKSHILPALRLSYHSLPAHLKRCFAYCALFPRDHAFRKDDLVLLWMAEGFVEQQQSGVRQMKSMGSQYFCDLLSRGLLQQSSSNPSCFVIHGLVHDLALHVAGETFCNLEYENMTHNEKGQVNFDKARHLSFFNFRVEDLERSGFLGKPNSSRTFLASSFHYFGHSVDEVILQLLQKLRCARVLSLRLADLVWKLPDSIGDLKHLRYIDLSHYRIKRLPDSVRFLVFLQTLILYCCTEITELPTGITDLVDLHHLDIRNTYSLEKMPPHMGNLKNLLMLPKFIVGESGGLRLKELNSLKHLRGELLIKDLHNASNIQDASEANLCEIEELDDLELRWTHDFHTPRNGSHEKQLLCQLKPNSKLRRIKIACYGGLKFPSWIGDPSFSKLEYLEFNNCARSTSLPWLGQLPQLKELVISGMVALKTMDCPKSGGKLPIHIPSLLSLEIRSCPQLTLSPMSLPSLQKLYMEDCNEAVLRSMVDTTSLTKLEIVRIAKLTCLPKSIIQYMTKLENVEIEECDELTFLLDDGEGVSSLASLKRMIIRRCHRLVSLTGQEQEPLPCSLEDLKLFDCAKIERLPNGLHSLACLRKLFIRGCNKFVGLVNDFPSHLKELQLRDLKALESLPDELLSGKQVIISNCPRLKFAPACKQFTRHARQKSSDRRE